MAAKTFMQQVIDRIVDEIQFRGEKIGDLTVDGQTPASIAEFKTLLANKLRSEGGGNTVGSSYLVLRSPDTTLWLIGVNDSGALQTTQISEGTPGTLHLFSPDNAEWDVTVTNEGALLTTEI